MAALILLSTCVGALTVPVSAATHNTVYISDSGSDANDGLTESTPVKTLTKAVQLLNSKNMVIADSNTIVLVGDVTCDTDQKLYSNKHIYPITVTSKAGEKYALKIKSLLRIGGETLFTNIKLISATAGYNGDIWADGNKLTIGAEGCAFDDVVTFDTSAGSVKPLSVYGGSAAGSVANKPKTVTLNCGTYQNIYTGSGMWNQIIRGDVNFVINNIKMDGGLITLGSFLDLSGTYKYMRTDNFTSNAGCAYNVTINGGTFKNTDIAIGVAGANENKKGGWYTATTCSFGGKVTLDINGGTFDSDCNIGRGDSVVTGENFPDINIDMIAAYTGLAQKGSVIFNGGLEINIKDANNDAALLPLIPNADRGYVVGTTVNPEGLGELINGVNMGALNQIIKCATVALGSDFGVCYYVPVSVADGFEGFALVKTDTATKLPRTDGTKMIEGTECYEYVYSNISPEDLAAFDVVASFSYEGKSYTTAALTYGVATYCYNMLASTANAELKTLLVDVLNYGAAAQQYVGATGELINAELTPEQKALATQSIGVSDDTVNETGISDIRATLILKDRVAFHIGVPAASYSEGMKAVVTYGNGKVWESALSEGEEGDYYFTFSELRVSELDEKIYVKFVEQDGTATGTLTYSVASYVCNSSAGLILDALMKYITSANIYVDKYGTPAMVTLPEDKFTELNAMFASRIEEIESTENFTVPADATVYYVSSKNGNDSNNGTSKDTPWKTIDKVNKTVTAGTSSAQKYVLFERGSEFRGETIIAKDYVTYSAYGTGEKPILNGSKMNYANATWESVGTNLWKYNFNPNKNWYRYYGDSTLVADIGMIVFTEKNGTQHFGEKAVMYNGKNQTTNPNLEDFTGYTSLSRDMQFFCENFCVYVYSTQNPAQRFQSIEMNANIFGIMAGKTGNYNSTGIVIDNLAIINYGQHGVATGNATTTGGTGLTKDLTVQNCVFKNIGGAIQNTWTHYNLQTGAVNSTVEPVRLGNAVEVYGGFENYTVQNCYISQVYDTGITFQYRNGIGTTKTVNAKNAVFRDNVIENCAYSIEYWHVPMVDGKGAGCIDGVIIDGCLMRYAGVGITEQRPIPSAVAHINSFNHENPLAQDTPILITNCVFMYSTRSLIYDKYGMYEGNSKYEGNIFVQTVTNGFGYTNNENIAVFNENVEEFLKKLDSKGEFYYSATMQ